METVDLSDPQNGGTVYECRSGDAFSLPILGEEDSTGALVNLASYGPSWSSQLRQRAADTLPAATFVVDQSNIAGTVNPGHDAPQLVLSLPGSVTAGMDVGLYLFDVQVTGGSVSPYTPYFGKLRITRDVTRG